MSGYKLSKYTLEFEDKGLEYEYVLQTPKYRLIIYQIFRDASKHDIVKKGEIFLNINFYP